MANPWDRQPRESEWLSEPGELSCHVCGSATDSLKQYQFVSWMVFYLVGASYQKSFYRGCPGCMRKLIAGRMAWNLVPANLLWFALVLPWGVWLIVASFRKGHSPDVIRNIHPDEAAAREARLLAAAHEVSWGRVWVIVAILFCWAPLFGLLLAAIAYLTNRKSLGWLRTLSIVALAVSVMIHLAIVVIMATG